MHRFEDVNSENEEGFRGSVLSGGAGDSRLVVGVGGAVAFVAYEGSSLSEPVGFSAVASVAQSGAFVDPVVGVLHGVSVEGAVAGPFGGRPHSSVAETHAGEGVLRISYAVGRGCPPLVGGGQVGVFLADVVVGVGDERGVPVGRVDPPPAGVGAEERDVPAVADERFRVGPHPFAPVFVVADAEDEVVGGEEVGVLVEVEVGGVLDGVAVALQPADEGASQ
ncbi:hypothetical protein O1L60_38630 [Streptomyces diastatochromogenes]|nr:hypothetical protein [Streptomyces diastatochromogenes]